MHLPRVPIRFDPLIKEAKRRARRRQTAILLGTFALCLVSYATFTWLNSGPVPRPTAAGQKDTILSKARAQHSVHYTSWASMGAPATGFTTGDVTEGRGILRLTVRAYVTKKRTFGVTVVVIGHTAYARGGASGIESWLELPRAKALRYAGRWISIPRRNAHYQTLAQGGTLDSFLGQITPRNQLKTSASTLKGRKVIGIDGTKFGGAVHTSLTADASSLLPISAGYVAAGGQGQTTISRWNEPVRVRAPAHSISLATVRRR